MNEEVLNINSPILTEDSLIKYHNKLIDSLNNKVVAIFNSKDGIIELSKSSVTELLLTLYEGFQNGTYSVPDDKTITYNVYGYNEFSGHLINRKWHNFSIDGIFLNINIVGYQNAELKTTSTHESGPLFLFSDYGSSIVTNVHISNVKFSNYTPQATSWEHGYFKFRCGHDGTLSIDNCLFLENGLRLNEGSSNSVTNCQFQSTNSSKYCLWVGCNAFKSGYFDSLQDVIIDNCTFTGYRGAKILTDTKTTHTSENATNYKRESQSITISNCLFKDLTKKPGIVVDSKFTDADGHSSFYTGESKLKIFNTSFINCTEGTIIVDDAFKSTKGILYSIDGEVRNAYNIDTDAGITCETSIIKNLAFIDDFDRFIDNNLVKWSKSDNKIIDSGHTVDDFARSDHGHPSDDSKLNISGGTIEGDLIVEGDLTISGITTTENHKTLEVEDNYIVVNSNGADIKSSTAGIVFRKNSTSSYGVVYDPTSDSILLGLGTYTENNISQDNSFTLDKDEGLPVVVRDGLVDGNLIQFSKDGNKVVDSGRTTNNLVHESYYKSMRDMVAVWGDNDGTIVVTDSIWDNFCKDDKKVQLVVISTSVTSIGKFAFYNCSGLKSIEIPDSITSIGQNAFYGCDSLNSIEIPDSVTSIGAGIFSNCPFLYNVTLPNNITILSAGTFDSCIRLNYIEIPASVTIIGADAFSGCSKLESITFKGTKAQWNKIEKYSGWNDSVPATKVVCSDGEVGL